MISSYSPPLPDELLWSSLARFHARFPALTAIGISSMFFDRPTWTIGKFLPTHLEAFAVKLPLKFSLNAETILHQHTLYPFVTPLLTRTGALELRSSMIEDGLVRGVPLGFSAIGGATNKTLNFCPDCYSEDRKKYGVAYWHRWPQLPGAVSCDRHRRDLIPTTIRWDAYGYIPLESVVPPSKAPSIISSPSQVQLSTSANLKFILQTDFPSGRYRLREALMSLLVERNFSGTRQKCAKELESRLIQRIGNRRLAALNAPLPPTRANWVRKLLSPRTKPPPRLLMHYYAILCAALRIPLEELYARTSAISEEPEQAPWPCVSEDLQCSGQLTIHRTKIYCVKGVRSYQFRCPACGACYRRPAPLRRLSDGTFEHQLTRHPVKRSAVENDSRHLRRRLLQIVARHPRKPLGLLPAEGRYLYGYLLLRAPEFIVSQIRPLLPSKKGRRFGRIVHWSSLDDEIARKLRDNEVSIVRAALQNSALRGVTRHQLLRHARAHVNIQRRWLPNIPQSAAWIGAHIETQNQRIARLVVKAYVEWATNSQGLRFPEILRRSGLWEFYYSQRHNLKRDIRIALGVKGATPEFLRRYRNGLNPIVPVVLPEIYTAFLDRCGFGPSPQSRAA